MVWMYVFQNYSPSRGMTSAEYETQLVLVQRNQTGDGYSRTNLQGNTRMVLQPLYRKVQYCAT